MNNLTQYLATGKRKTSIARVFLRVEKDKNFLVGNKKVEEYFLNSPRLLKEINKPLIFTNNLNKFNIYVNVKGGGLAGQADAIKYGISKALVELDENNKKILKEENLLTRDARVKERKKYGKKKARKSPQFSKR